MYGQVAIGSTATNGAVYVKDCSNVAEMPASEAGKDGVLARGTGEAGADAGNKERHDLAGRNGNGCWRRVASGHNGGWTSRRISGSAREEKQQV